MSEDDVDVAAELEALERLGGGGIASFIGVVRGEGGLVALEIEHYPAMTLTAMIGIAEQVCERWTLLGLTMIHRHGRLAPGGRIVFVGAAAKHRGAAIGAVEFSIDWLKTSAPFWKREHFSETESRWIEPRVTDHATAARWRPD